MSTLRIEAADYLRGDAEPIKADAVRFVAADGRTMFEVRVAGDSSIEVRGVDNCKVGDERFSCWLFIRPQAANSVLIQTLKH